MNAQPTAEQRRTIATARTSLRLLARRSAATLNVPADARAELTVIADWCAGRVVADMDAVAARMKALVKGATDAKAALAIVDAGVALAAVGAQ